jgi:hypothetical protein
MHFNEQVCLVKSGKKVISFLMHLIKDQVHIMAKTAQINKKK